MRLSNFFKRLLPILMAVALVIPSATVLAAPNDEDAGQNNNGVTWEKVEDVSIKGLTPAHKDNNPVSDVEFIAEGNVRVSIIVDGDSTIGAGYDTQGIGTNPSAIRYRGEVLANQKALAQKISKEVLGGAELDVVWNLTLAANIISANVPAIKVDAIKAVDGVKDVVIETMYEPSATVEADDPSMSVASGMTGVQTVWASGYTGAGSKVAIIDTGLDTDHELFDGDAFEYAIEQTGKTVDLLETSDIAAVLNQLNIKAAITDVSEDDLYLTSKVPFAANYVDVDLDVTHDNDNQGEHGSHVAGIAAANRFVMKDGEFKNSLEAVLTQGEAPDAQIFVMKVFGKGGGAYDSDYFAAIEDAIILGADSVNLSLGSAVAGLPYETTYNDILEEMTESDTVVVMSAGNNSYWSEQTYIPYNYSDNANFATGGSPGSFKNSFTVASVDNDGFTGNYIKQGDNLIFFTENLGYGNTELAKMPGEFKYVYIDAIGTDAQFAAVADDINGNIAVCNRGSSSFFEKANAAVANGAAATIIANNQAGTINMNLTGYAYKAPCVSITLADANLLKTNAESTDTVEVDGASINVYYGTLSVSSDALVTHYDADNYTMSSFSSWGVPGDLSLKPEITAPGGNIYSVNGAIAGGQSYENMSGTSMAAPQIAGLAAVFKQYIRENDLTTKTGFTERQLTNSLFMSTAKPLIEEDAGYYYSVMKQGAGLVDLDAAVNSKTFIMMDKTATDSAADGKIKVELGDDPEREGTYSAAFTINNFSDEAQLLNLDAEFFTQDAFAYYGMTFRDTWTAPLESVVSWTVDGNDVAESFDYFDFNDDKEYDQLDAVALLDYVVGNLDHISNEDRADLDADGDIDTYDAYLALSSFDENIVAVPANGSVTVKADFTILNADDYDDNGTYIEGYLFASELESMDGAIGAAHSIPVLGYYGSWSEFGSTDIGSYLEFQYELEDRIPYMYAALEDNAFYLESYLLQYAGDRNSYYFGGNPYDIDEEYMPERNAMNSTSTISAFRYTQIRNSAGRLFTVTDAAGNELFRVEGDENYAAYYYPNGGEWRSTSTQFKTGFKPEAIAEGTELTMNITFAPEYYRNDDGTIEWDALHENATLSTPVVIDNTEPEILDIESVTDDEGAVTALNVTVKDNEYIASIGLYNEDDEEISVFGSDVEAEKGAEATYTFDLSENTDDHVYIFVGDYAANESIYKINFNTEELDDDVIVELTTALTRILVGNTTKVTAKVTPWGVDETVTFTSSDETVATVDEKGIVTGVAKGNVTITATSVLDTEASGSVDIEVFTIPMTAYGILQDESGTPLFFAYDFDSTEGYVPLAEVNADLTAASWDWNADEGQYFYQQDSEGYINKIDIGTFETADKSAASTGFGAPMEDIDFPFLVNVTNEAHELLGVYGGYLLFSDDVMDNSFTSGYDLTSFLNKYTGASQFIAFAWGGIFNDEDDPDTEEDESASGDEFLALDDAGYLWVFYYYTDGGLDLAYIPTSLNVSLSSIGETTGNSLVMGDDGEFYLAHFNGSTSELYQLGWNSDTKSFDATRIGDVGEDVWPAALLTVIENESEDDGNMAPRELNRSSIPADAVISVAEFSKDDLADIDAAGTLNGVREVTTPSDETVVKTTISKDTAEPQGAGAYSNVTLEITVDEDDTHNALYEITWDPDLVQLVSSKGYGEFQSKIETTGLLRFGFVDEDGFAADSAVLELTFKYRRDNLDQTMINITTLDNNSENPGTVDTFVLKGNGNIDSGNGVTGIAIDPSLYVVVNDNAQITPVITPADAMIQDVTYKSADESIATVDENGVVTGVKVGKTTITATTVDGGFSATCDVLVMFEDVQDPEAFYFDAVYWAVENDITTGTSPTTFSPTDTTTRGQVVTFLYRTAGEPTYTPGETPFKDVKSGKYYYTPVYWALANEITTGTSPTAFSPNDGCTRGQILTFIWRYAGCEEVDFVPTFSDVTNPSKYFYKPIAWAEANGMIIDEMVVNNKFAPNQVCTRAETVAYLYALSQIQD